MDIRCDPSAGLTFIGRTRELAALNEAYDAPRSAFGPSMAAGASARAS
jgi:hypothetical protein